MRVNRGQLLIGVAVTTMVVATFIDNLMVMAWAVFLCALGVGFCVRDGVIVAVRRWSHRVYEEGFKAGRQAGAEEGVREGMLLAQAERDGACSEKPTNHESLS